MAVKQKYGLWKRTLVSIAVAVLALLSAPVAFAGAPAGASIDSTATATFQIEGAPSAVVSNTVTTRIDEVLDVTLTPKSARVVSLPLFGLAGFGVPFLLTNTGNGNEAFQVEAAAPGQALALTVAIDVDGNGAYDPAVDITLSQGGTTPVLAPGASFALLLLFGGAPGEAGSATIAARAMTGSGAPATQFPGQADGGGNALVGATRAVNPRAVPGAVMEYCLTIRNAGPGIATG